MWSQIGISNSLCPIGGKILKEGLLGFLAVVASLLFSSSVHAKTASEVFEAASHSIVVIKTYGVKGETQGLGSGVVVAEGVVATNCHVIEDTAKVQVVYQQSNYSATLRHGDRDRDVCTLTVNGLKAPAVDMGTTGGIKVGAKVYAIGAPQGLVLTLSEGIISSLRPVKGGQYLQISAPISPGSSGGGLFDDEGRLIGLPTFYLTEGQQLNFAVPVEWVVALPTRHKQNAETTLPPYIDWLNTSIALVAEKDWEGLKKHALRWTEKQPLETMAWYALGYAYLNSHQANKAIAAYQQALRIDPEDSNAWGLSGLATAYIFSGNIAKAIEVYLEALRVNPEDPKLWSALGYAYEESGQIAKAINAYQQAVNLDPKDAQAWFILGMSVLPEQTTKAIDAFQQALNINPEHILALYGLGVAYRKSGQTDKVMAVYKLLKALDSAKAEDFFNKVVLP